MSKFLREEDISMGFRAPLYSVPVCIPECNVCIHRDGPGKCKKLGTPSDDLRFGKRHDCPDAVLNTSHFYIPNTKIVPGRVQGLCQKVNFHPRNI